MAKYRKYGYKKNFKRKNKVKKNKRSPLEKLAYDLGRIEIGKNNPDSKVYSSYQRGKSQSKYTARKPLI